MSTIVPGNKVYILGGASPSYGSPDYNATAGFFVFVSGDAATGMISFVGDPATPSTNGFNGRPVILSDGLLFYNCHGFIWDSLWFVTGSENHNGYAILAPNGGTNIVRNCVCDLNGYDISFITDVVSGGAPSKLFNTEVYSSVAARGGTTNAAVKFGHFGGNLTFCNIHNNIGEGVSGANFTYVRNSIIAKNGGNGITFTTEGATYQSSLWDCTVDGNLGSGVVFATPQDLLRVAVGNNHITNHTGSGKFGVTVNSTVTKAANDRLKCFFDYNTYYGNTNDFNADLSYGAHDIHGGSNPYVGQSTQNYSLVNTITERQGYPNAPYAQHLSGQTKTVQTALTPSGVQPRPNRTPVVLSYTNAFPNSAFPQHTTSQTTTVQNFMFPGAVQLSGAVTGGLPKMLPTLPGGMLISPGVGVAAHSLLALRRNLNMSRRRAMGFIGWNKE